MAGINIKTLLVAFMLFLASIPLNGCSAMNMHVVKSECLSSSTVVHRSGISCQREKMAPACQEIFTKIFNIKMAFFAIHKMVNREKKQFDGLLEREAFEKRANKIRDQLRLSNEKYVSSLVVQCQERLEREEIAEVVENLAKLITKNPEAYIECFRISTLSKVVRLLGQLPGLEVVKQTCTKIAVSIRKKLNDVFLASHMLDLSNLVLAFSQWPDQEVMHNCSKEIARMFKCNIKRYFSMHDLECYPKEYLQVLANYLSAFIRYAYPNSKANTEANDLMRAVCSQLAGVANGLSKEVLASCDVAYLLALSKNFDEFLNAEYEGTYDCEVVAEADEKIKEVIKKRN